MPVGPPAFQVAPRGRPRAYGPAPILVPQPRLVASPGGAGRVISIRSEALRAATGVVLAAPAAARGPGPGLSGAIKGGAKGRVIGPQPFGSSGRGCPKEPTREARPTTAIRAKAIAPITSPPRVSGSSKKALAFGARFGTARALPRAASLRSLATIAPGPARGFPASTTTPSTGLGPSVRTAKGARPQQARPAFGPASAGGATSSAP